MEKVAVVCISDIEKDLADAIELVDGFEVDDDDFVVIKPNLCDFRHASEGGTTDVRLVEAFVRIIRKKANPKIAVVESDHAIGNADEEFYRMGYAEVAEKLGVKLINLSREERVEVVLEGHYFKILRSTRTLLKATKIVSIAKLKTHSQYRMTCSMKNIFGLLPMKNKTRFHSFMPEVLADLNEFYKPSLCIIDGIVGMEGPGPSDGVKKELGIIICGRNAVSIDAVAARIMGFKPKSVPYLKFAEKKQLGTMTNVKILGNININSFRKFEFIPIYSYVTYRTAIFFPRMGCKIKNFLDNLSKFLSQVSIGLIILVRGYYISSEFGTLLRKDVYRYGKGILLRVLTMIRLMLQ